MTTREFKSWLQEVAGLRIRKHEATSHVNLTIFALQRLLEAPFFTEEQRKIVESELAGLMKIRKLISKS